MAALSRERLTTFLRSISLRQVRLVSGVILFAYLVSHFLNHALGNISLEALATGVAIHVALWQFLPVTILFYAVDPTCTSAPTPIPTATLTTNGAGNGTARFTFAAGPPSTLPTSGIRWQLSTAAGVAYETDCAPLDLD